MLAERVAAVMPHTMFANGRSTEEIPEEARMFYLDTALVGHRPALKTLLEFAKPDHILCGSDGLFAPTEAIERFTEAIEEYRPEIVSTPCRSFNTMTDITLVPLIIQYVERWCDVDCLA